MIVYYLKPNTDDDNLITVRGQNKILTTCPQQFN